VETGTWVLQADAATATGFSVSAIRKWRRTGLVADRKRTTAGGLERVEVRLEDVEARLAEQPAERPRPGHPSPPPPAAPPTAAAPIPDAGPPAGTATIPIADLEALFGRVRAAEVRAEQAEARLQAAEVEARFMSGQLAELRRQVQTAGAEAVAGRAAAEDRAAGVPVMAPTAGAAPPQPVAGGNGRATSPRRAFDRLTLDRGAADLLGVDPGRDAVLATPPPAQSAIATPTPIRPSPPGPDPRGTAGAARPPFAATDRGDAARGPTPAPVRNPQPAGRPRETEIDSLAAELRRLYARLDGYRREPTISRSRERQRERDLGDYDTSLLRACSALGVPTGLRPDEPVSIERRATLTKTLARLGLDVRADSAAASQR
jgi:hypothetical protein